MVRNHQGKQTEGGGRGWGVVVSQFLKPSAMAIQVLAVGYNGGFVGPVVDDGCGVDVAVMTEVRVVISGSGC